MDSAMTNAHTNDHAIASIKFVVASLSGSVAGILGLTNIHGVALFLLATVLSAGAIWGVNCKGRLGVYLDSGSGGWKGLGALVVPSMDVVFAFLLTWSLFYGEWRPFFVMLCYLLVTLRRHRA
jgi:ER membrane protein complex subunit 6